MTRLRALRVLLAVVTLSTAMRSMLAPPCEHHAVGAAAGAAMAPGHEHAAPSPGGTEADAGRCTCVGDCAGSVPVALAQPPVLAVAVAAPRAGIETLLDFHVSRPPFSALPFATPPPVLRMA